jgi:hypothetical protein
MAYTTIDKPDDYFNTVLYTGDDVDGRAITTGFQTDWTWIKRRNDTNSHIISDIVRGATYKLDSSSANAEVNNYDGGHLESFTSTGFTLGEGSVNSGHTNATGGTYVSWNWKAGGTAVSNTVGDITSSVSANTTAGFSIVSYTGTGANATVGHGLGVAPKMIIIKNRDSAENWIVGGSNITTGWTGYLALNLTDDITTASNIWQDTTPDSDKFSIGASGKVNGSTHGMVAYCFAEVKGYSKFGSYTGNGSADGTFVYTGFKPAFVMVKRTDTTGNWWIHDNGRNTYNVLNKYLFADSSSAEGTDDNMDFLSNGFKLRVATYQPNTSGGTWIYLAIAEQPFVTSTTNGSIPATAR